MSQKETIYKHNITQGLQVARELHVVPLVEAYTRANEHFKIHYKATGADTSDEALFQELREPKPLTAFWRGALYPILSDPNDQTKGAVAIDVPNQTLLYSTKFQGNCK